MSYNNFIFYKEWIQQIRLLACSDDPRDILSFCDGLETFLDGQDADGDSMTLMATLVYNQMTAQIWRDKEQYEEISRKRSEAGQKGVEAKRSKRKQNEANVSNDKQTQASVSLKEEEEEEDDVSPNGDNYISSALTVIDGLPEPVPAETDPKKLTDRMLTEEFDTLWKSYPRKVGKQDALRHYKSARKSGITFETIQNGLWNYENYSRGQPEKYIMNGSTWFCGHHWEDRRDKPVSDYERILAL